MPPKTDPFGIDFHAFRVLITVDKYQSFTRAAEALGINQSAVSYTIDKLRHVFSDPLFVRQGRTLIATKRCLDVLDMAQRMSAEFLTVTAPQDFDPTTTTERLVIACNYYEQVLFVPDILRNLRQQAPHLTVEIIDSSDTGHERLLSGEADILIGPFERTDAGFFTRALFEEHYACVMDPNHPMADAPIDLETYLSFDHVQITYGGKWKSQYILALEAMNRPFHAALKVPSPAEIQAILVGTHLVATCPKRLSDHVGPNVKVRPCPVPAPFTIRLAWTARTQTSAMHLWARALINTSVRKRV